MTDTVIEDRLEEQIIAFEHRWQQGLVPEISEFLPSDLKPEDREVLLRELICVDLEYRWQAARQPGQTVLPFQLQDYQQRFPELGPLAIFPAELIEEEYRMRWQWGDQPAPDQFLARFPKRSAELRPRLEAIDQELFAETLELPKPSTQQTTLAVAFPFLSQLDPKAPLLYSDYLLQKLLGAGLMGRVYRAWQRSLDRPVAVKYLRKSFHQDQDAVERFLAEARTVARLQHPAIVGIHGLGRTRQGGYFIVMDWIDGPDLARVIKERSPLPWTQAVRWTCEACSAMEKAHELGIVHCDLKPGNILLDSTGRIRVTDFGLSRSLADDSRSEEGIAGTAAFMAPEQVSRHWGPIDAHTDIFGLGAVLYTLLTGQPPHPGHHLADVLGNAVSRAPVVLVQTLRPEIPKELNEVCMKSLAKPPEERWGSAAEFALALQGILQEFE